MSDVIRNAQRAQDFLKDELIIKIFETLEDEIKSHWQTTSPGKSEEREQLYYELRALESIKRKLRGYVDNGIIYQKKG